MNYIRHCRLLFCILSALIFFNCATEEDISKKGKNGKYVMEKKSFDDVLNIPVFNEAYRKLTKTKGQITNRIDARTALEEEYNFTIVPTAPVKIVTDEQGAVNYIMLIERPVKEDLKFENLVIALKGDDIKAFVMKYAVSEEPVKEGCHNSYTVAITDYKMEYLPIDGKQFFGCITVTVTFCTNTGGGQYSPMHLAEGVCFHDDNYLFDVITTTCANVNSGPPSNDGPPATNPGTGSGGSGSNGGGSNGGGDGDDGEPDYDPQDPDIHGDGNPPPVVIVVPQEEAEEEGDPCKKVKKPNNAFPLLKPALLALAQTTTQNSENGVFIDADATLTTPVQTVPQGIAGTININLNPTKKYVVLGHTHNAPANSTYSIFSWDDMSTINRLIVENHIDISNFVFYVVTADGTRYAITIENASSLQNFFGYMSNTSVGQPVDVAKLLTGQQVFDTYYNKVSGKIKINSNSVDDKKAFLEFLKAAKMDVSLYEVNATFTTYNKLSLDRNGAIQSLPCPN